MHRSRCRMGPDGPFGTVSLLLLVLALSTTGGRDSTQWLTFRRITVTPHYTVPVHYH